MKRRLTLILCFLYICLIGQSEYFEFPYEGWKQTILYSDGFGIYRVESIRQSSYLGDTILEGKQYKVLNRAGLQNFFFRFDNGKVFQRMSTFNGTTNVPFDQITLDFTLNEGDTLKGFGFLPQQDLTITTKERILVNQDSLWYIEIQIDQWNTIKWLEGVGDLQTGLIATSGVEEAYQHICTHDAVNQTVAVNNELFSTEGYSCVDVHGLDMDQDGFSDNYDCDDNNPDVNPIQMEIPYNGLDDDCNSATLDDDLDQDGFALTQDCDDDNSNINPNQSEIPYNGLDDDCNSTTLDDDLDQDGFDLAQDCDDDNSEINPDAIEIPNNGIDEDCDGVDLVSSVHELANAKINIYPNPVVDIINIDVEGSIEFQVNLYDAKGKVVHSMKNFSKLIIETIPSGIYLLEITDLNTKQRVIERIIIQK